MKIISDFKIEKCVAGKKEEREGLKHIFIRRHKDDKGYALATNGVVLVRVPVTLEEGDVPGALPPEALKYGRKVQEGSERVQIQLADQACVVTPDIAAAYHRHQYVAEPRFEGVIPCGKSAFTVIAFSVAKLAQVAAAIGADRVVLEIRDSTTPIIVRPNGASDCLGLLAPCELEAKQKKAGGPTLPGIEVG